MTGLVNNEEIISPQLGEYIASAQKLVEEFCRGMQEVSDSVRKIFETIGNGTGIYFPEELSGLEELAGSSMSDRANSDPSSMVNPSESRREGQTDKYTEKTNHSFAKSLGEEMKDVLRQIAAAARIEVFLPDRQEEPAHEKTGLKEVIREAQSICSDILRVSVKEFTTKSPDVPALTGNINFSSLDIPSEEDSWEKILYALQESRGAAVQEIPEVSSTLTSWNAVSGMLQELFRPRILSKPSAKGKDEIVIQPSIMQSMGWVQKELSSFDSDTHFFRESWHSLSSRLEENFDRMMKSGRLPDHTDLELLMEKSESREQEAVHDRPAIQIGELKFAPTIHTEGSVSGEEIMGRLRQSIPELLEMIEQEIISRERGYYGGI